MAADGRRGMENALRAKPEDVRQQYERQFKALQEVFRISSGSSTASKPLQYKSKAIGDHGAGGIADRAQQYANRRQ